jgi:hypothetical protein
MTPTKNHWTERSRDRGTALASKATVITATFEEFARVDGLVVENWR